MTTKDHVAQMREQEGDLVHFGVKGMKWGVRKRDKTASSGPSEPQSVTVTRDTKTGGVKAKGGAGHPLSDDAVVAAAIRQKARASGAASLSNKELETLVKRLNLEANYAKAMAANAPPKGRGRAFIEGIIKQETGGFSKGKMGPLTMMVQAIIKQQKAKRAASAAASAGAAAVGRAVLTGRVVN